VLIEIESLTEFDLFDGIRVVTSSTPHTIESHAIRLSNTNGKSIVFSSDTGFSKPLGSFAMDADLFLVECSYVKNKPVDGHLELVDAVHLARYSRARKTVITHLYPEWESVNFNEEMEKIGAGIDLTQAYDGLKLEI